MTKTINNSIKESYCSFEVSKLLKEKGCELKCNSYYDVDKNVYYIHPALIKFGKQQNEEDDEETFDRSTHALAIEWIRVNFEIWIQIEFGKDEDNIWWNYYVYKLKKNYDYSNESSESGFNSPQEATEMALLYVLKNLIK